jgi:hypothetical protein
MTEFFTADATPWHRRLRDIGSLLALEELWEAGRWQAANVLSAAACDWQRNQLAARLGPDLGLGDRDLRREITTLLKAPVPDPSPARRRLRQIVDHARPDYLRRWAAAAGSAPEKITPERYARTLAAHLLDLGFSGTYLRAWGVGLARQQGLSLADIADAAAEVADTPPRTFDVLVLLEKVPHPDAAQQLPQWRTRGQVKEWLTAEGHDVVRCGGGFEFGCTAREPYAAADQARRLVERLTARAAFLRKSRDGVVPVPRVWVRGHAEPIDLPVPARGADLLTLNKENHLYRVSGPQTKLDDALELAAAVNRGALAPAVAGGWAAVESLLCHPDDPKNDDERSGKAVAADRFAAIVACSWPRAELTALSHRHDKAAGDALARSLDGCLSNLDRARAVSEAIAGHGPDILKFGRSGTRHTDPAAAQRMAKLLGNPKGVLNDVVGALRITMRRLYRARNIVLHGGATQGVALNAALRTAAPIFGAGLDRMVHAAQTEGLDPLDLAARAEVALQLVGGETGLSIVDLLEPARP